MWPKRILWISLLSLWCLVYGWYVYQSEIRFAGPYLKPGETYRVGETTHTLPMYPLSPSPARILCPQRLARQEQLLRAAMDALRPWDAFLMCGTLLGWIRHGGTLIPWDDDIDVAVDLRHRRYFYSRAFVQYMARAGLETIYLRHNDATQANHFGSMVRLRFVGDSSPVVDIVFMTVANSGVDDGEDYAAVVEMRADTGVYTYPKLMNGAVVQYSDVYPVSWVEGIGLPAQPKKVIAALWSEKALEDMRAVSTALHVAPFQILGVWQKTAPQG
jgi:LicD family